MMKPAPQPLTDPWAITPEGMQLVLSVWSRGEIFGEVRERALEARRGAPLDNARSVTVRDGIAVIPIEGPLFRHASLFADVSGATSYETIRRDLQAALDAPDVRAILLVVNSPGGEVDGVAELGDAIFAARGIKPVEAYVGGMGASAAYWLASAASRITCAETAMLGSIGVRITLVDDSKRDEANGRRQVEIVSSQSPDKRATPVDDDLLGRVQARADAIADVFLAHVARHRSVSMKTVASDFGRGDVLVGQAAVQAGLADEIGSYEGVLARMIAAARSTKTPAAGAAASAAPTSKTERMNMKKPHAHAGAGTPSASMDDEQCDECGKALGDSDAVYCGSCYNASAKAKADDDEADEDAEDDEADEEEARALGLAAAADRKQRLARMRALAAFERDMLAIHSVSSVDEAIGRARAGVGAIGDLARVTAEQEAAASASRQREWRDVLTAAAGSRASLGELAAVVPTFLKDEQAKTVLEALEALETQTTATVVGALCGVGVSAKSVARVKAWLDAKAPTVPAARAERRIEDAEKQRRASATEAQARRLNLTVDDASALAGLDSPRKGA